MNIKTANGKRPYKLGQALMHRATVERVHGPRAEIQVIALA